MRTREGEATLEDQTWQRLDKWLWCARFMKARSDCARFIGGGAIRLNRQATDKPHARLRVGDVLTVPWRGDIRVVRVLALAPRRGPPPEALGLYEELPETGSTGADLADAAPEPPPCAATKTSAYRRL